VLLRRVVPAVVLLGCLAVVLRAACGCWTDWLWFRSLGYPSVLTTRLEVRGGLFAAGGAVSALVLGLCLRAAYRRRPPLSAMSAEQRRLERWRTRLGARRRLALAAVCAAAGAAGGAVAATQWQTYLAWRNATAFRTRDPQFHLDVSFYTFDLPWYRFLVGFGLEVLLLALAGTALVHYLWGAIRLQGPGRRVDRCARCQLSVLLGLLLAVKAGAYWLDRYAMEVRTTAAPLGSAPGWTGLRFVDADALLPAKTLLCWAALICAVLLLSAPLRRGGWAPGLLGTVVLAVTALLVTGVYPLLVREVSTGTAAAARSRESAYAQRNIAATREAFGVAGVRTTGLSGGSGGTDRTGGAGGAGAAAASTALDSVELLDPQLAGAAASATMGADQGAVVGVRDPAGTGTGSASGWAEAHLVRTHGTGLVSVADGGAGAGRGPVLEQVPGSYPRDVYYGTAETGYAVTSGAAARGTGGVGLSAPLTRAAYAVRFASPQLLFSKAVGAGSSLLYDRTPGERVSAAAPWLTVDGEPYPALSGGRIVWVVDGYTTSDSYPDATVAELGGGGSAAPPRRVRYVRDAVKATVDAYSGAVTLYQWDTADPVLRTWMKAFPGTVRPRADLPAALVAQFRYPTDLFSTQQAVLARYHVTDAADFLSGADVWRPTAQTPTYASVRMPGRDSADWSITATYTTGTGGTVRALLAADSAPGPDYGTLRLVTASQASAAPGPGGLTLTAAERAGDSARLADPSSRPAGTVTDGTRAAAEPAGGGAASPGASPPSSSSPPDQAPSPAPTPPPAGRLRYGRLLTLPVDGALLDVQPVYVTGADGRGLRLECVLAEYRGRRADAPDLASALREVHAPAA